METIIFGSTATSLAVIAIATTGFLLLSRRVDWRRGARVLLGCFILFGASSLAASLLNAARSSATTDPPAPAIELFTPPPPPPPQAIQPKTVCWTCGTTTPPAPPN